MKNNLRDKRWFQKFGEFLSGEPFDGKPIKQPKSVKMAGSFLSNLIGIMVLFGMVIAFGVWGLAVVGIILAISMLKGKAP